MEHPVVYIVLISTPQGGGRGGRDGGDLMLVEIFYIYGVLHRPYLDRVPIERVKVVGQKQKSLHIFGNTVA